ncbi:hypothetical protein KC717_03280 [Candidatus Dojkabacteria bacterium]|uniref:Dockerin domain-containing protein n=1 Tax=Candidatus Dojkabacteria bacterium TaxID=2099670 RepID=A0A955RKC7_9BACT|nr:hypothetical protein [Candidatus Dojkabacteria bacterium]
MSILLSIFCINLVSLYFFPTPVEQDGAVLGSTSNVGVATDVYSVQLTFQIIPEGRAPNNYSTEVTVDIYDSATKAFEGSFTTITDNLGYATVNLDQEVPAIYLEDKPYDFVIKGISHLTIIEYSVVGFDKAGANQDFFQGINYLMVGDVNGDDEINSLDLTNFVSRLGVVFGDAEYDFRYDLDYDGDIDLDDISLFEVNIYEIGEGY